MSSEVWFYHLERSEVEAALPPLVEKCLARGWRALIRGGVQERLEALDLALWTFRDDSFLPHGCEGRDEPERAPVWLTTAGQGNPNRAQAQFLIDGAPLQDAGEFLRTVLVFDGRDPTALEQARARWRAIKTSGHALSYWKQDFEGRWSRQDQS